MSNKEKRIKRLKAARNLYDQLRCKNCGEIGSHYFPPSLNDNGGFICDKRK